MIATLRALSALLTYPSDELKASTREIAEALDGEALLGEDARAAIAPLVAELGSADLYELQERYVDLFDRSRSLSLHLFEHVYGESRDRGQMMVSLVERYQAHGLDIAVQELPDYLPLYLEYLSQLPLEQARRELGEPVAVIAALARRLEERRSPYGPVLAALERLATVEPDPRDLSDLQREEEIDASDPAALDQSWQEDPVVFAAALEQRKQLLAHQKKGGQAVIAFLNALAFGYYPYVALSIFIGGSIIRFNRGQYSWRSGSSQLLRNGQLVIGSSLFHYGVLIVLMGHFVGFLTPEVVLDVLGVSLTAHQLLAIVVGGIAGLVSWIGLTMLVHRRLFDTRVRRTSSRMDLVSTLLVWVQLTFGLATVPISAQHLDGSVFLGLVAYVQSIFYFQPNAAALLEGVLWVYKVHIFLGFTFFFIWPLSRLVHIWSAPIWYLGRAYQVVRRPARARMRQGMPS